jgi:hypothetical protein
MIETIISGIIIGIVVYFALHFIFRYEFKRIQEKIRIARAVSPETAVKPEEAGITDGWDKKALRRLVKEGKLGTTEDGRYYIVQK